MRQSAHLKEMLEREIVTGKIRAGERLEELDIANRFGVSRTPVREALMMLEAINLVERRPRRGAIVKGITLKRLLQMLEALAELEAVAGKLAARRGQTSEVAEIRAALAALDEAEDDSNPDAYYTANIRFHRAIYTASGNDELTRVTEEFAERMEPFLRTQHHSAGWIEKSRKEHKQILEAIESHDSETAYNLLLEHVHVDTKLFAEFAAGLNE